MSDYQLCKYIFKNNKLYVEDENCKYNSEDSRFEDTYLLLNETVEYCNKNNLHIPDTHIYIYIADYFPYIFTKEIPVFVFSTPYNLHYPLIPDNTFKCFSFEERWGKKCSKNIYDKLFEGIENRDKFIEDIKNFVKKDNNSDLKIMRNNLIKYKKDLYHIYGGFYKYMVTEYKDKTEYFDMDVDLL